MDLTFIADLYIPVIIAACLIIGFIMKKWIADVDNKWIPTTVCIAGAILSCIVNQSIDVTTLVAGAVSGLASTGCHQAFKQLIDKQN